ncbi:2Fe-2S iron-sulfur cluster binding domain-containing protein [Kocuria sp. JC486]|uniref:Ferredoxin n=1 Tax=Kocuria soli TaxID=2485125 RepID=A0A3N3ZTN5_9MICC|nr:MULTISPECIES: 2Fe-2S iron-sulfur cluster-binding protein [Kocuria]NHU86327.1 2Fe-2S iron-sulfur cluster binding domain-containing protein [Kocuria sp. JC486]ROZ65688.1 ferredoxin [Kocuria soli]
MSSITVNVIDRDGTRTEGVEWNSSESLMEALTRNKFPILATCGGNASCSTCHCYLGASAATATANSPIGDEEEDVLDMLDDTRHEDSRLTCQVEWSEELNGAEVTIAPEW